MKKKINKIKNDEDDDVMCAVAAFINRRIAYL